MGRVRWLRVAAALVIAGALCSCNCGPPDEMVVVEVGDQLVEGAAWTPLPPAGGTMELRRGLQGAVMVIPSARLVGLSNASGGRMEFSVAFDDGVVHDSEVPLDELLPGPTDGAFAWGSITPFDDPDMLTYLGRTVTIRVEVVGGGYFGEAEVEVTLVDDEMDP